MGVELTFEPASVAFGTKTIAYGLRRSGRRSTVSVAVDPEQGVVVTAPLGVARGKVDQLVRAKAMWILERLRRRRASERPAPPRELVSGETFRYLGKQHRLVLERRAELAPLRLQAGRLFLPVPQGLGVEHEARYARAALLDWYKARAKALLSARVATWAKVIGATPSKVLITEPPKRWGSAAADGSLRLNWRIVQAPSRLVDYVVAHELVHLVHADHGREFWALLGRVMPDYEMRKATLRELGPSLMW